jgi:multiple sugar transport system ATP-binding protein
MAAVELRDLTKRYGTVTAVDNVSLQIQDGEFLVLLGPSGCGKTTTLRLIAGLETATAGKIVIGERDVTYLRPGERGCAMVFQDYALYPHMSARDNLSFALRNLKYSKDEVKARVKQVAEMLQLETLLDRKPRQLSGGQRQRVALGRAIVRHPDVYLFDEPLSNLDAKLRASMRVELTDLHKRLGTTSIYVTHDQIEAMTLGTRICVMNHALIQQIGTGDQLYNQPRNTFVASFIGSPPMNLVTGCLEQSNGMLVTIDGEAKLRVPHTFSDRFKNYLGSEVVLGIRPENIRVSDEHVAPANWSHVTVPIHLVEDLGKEELVYFTLGKQPLIASVGSGAVAHGQTSAELIFNMDKLQLFDKATGEAIR